MYYAMILLLCVAGYCLITSEIKSRKRDRKHKRAEVIDFTGRLSK